MKDIMLATTNGKENCVRMFMIPKSTTAPMEPTIANLINRVRSFVLDRKVMSG
jgi:hypothetical protein